MADFPEVVWLFDTYSSGVYGFVPHGRIKKQIRLGQCLVAKVNGKVVAAAMGGKERTLWNIMVQPEYRHLHVGSMLVKAVMPERIRVKCRPHEGMSKADLERFTDPTPFYERMGYVFECWDYPRSFFSGVDKSTGKAVYHLTGQARSVKIMRRLKPGEEPPEPDQSRAVRVQSLDTAATEQRPRLRNFRQFP